MTGTTCAGCGKKFDIPPCRLKEKNYCSFKCYTTHRNSKIVSFCVICGKMIETFPSMIRHRGAGKYCSRACRNKGHIKKIKVRCQICGKDFYTIPGQVKRGRGKFCSIECRTKNRSINYKGEKASAWRGGVSFEPYCPKFNVEFRSRVRAFFNYRCVVCGLTEEENGKHLSVHHINYNKKACCDNSPKLFAALCHSCHSKTNHNRDEWNRYLNDLIISEYGGRCYYPNRVEVKS